MKFTPKKEEELGKKSFVLPAGEYEFSVMSAEDTKSTAGNEMIKVKLAVYPPDGGKPSHVYDNLLEAMAYKLRHFAFAVGLGEEYSSGKLEASECAGRGGLVTLKVGEYQGKPKNEVEDYRANGKPRRDNDTQEEDSTFDPFAG